MILFGGRDGAVDERGGDPFAVERVHLVFHQCDERRDDERESFELQRGKLIDERFARACGHNGKSVLFVEEGLNRFFLPRAEGVEAEAVMERRLKRHE